MRRISVNFGDTFNLEDGYTVTLNNRDYTGSFELRIPEHQVKLARIYLGSPWPEEGDPVIVDEFILVGHGEDMSE